MGRSNTLTMHYQGRMLVSPYVGMAQKIAAPIGELYSFLSIALANETENISRQECQGSEATTNQPSPSHT